MSRDYKNLAIEIVKNLRGKESQRKMSQRLHFSINHVYKWESGTSAIKWNEFIDVCLLVDFDIVSVLSSSMSFQANPKDICGLYRHLTLGRTNKEIAAIVSRPESLVRRWYRGDQELDLSEFLELCDKVSGAFPLFISSFYGIQIPNSFEHLEREIQEIRLTHLHPEASAVVYCLELDSYHKLKEHQEGFIAAATGISLEDERRFISAFEKSGIIEMRERKYVEKRTTPLDFRTKDARFNDLVAYWLKRGLHQMESGMLQRPKSISAYHVFPVSQKCYEKVQELSFAFYNQLVTLVNKDEEPREFVAAMTLMTMDICAPEKHD